MCLDRDESDLRMLCIEQGLAPTGSADELVDRLLAIDPTGWLLGYAGELLQCSEITTKTLRAPQKEREPTDNEVTWEMLKARAQHAAREGNLASCRNVHLEMANHLMRRDKKAPALQALCVVCVFDLCGARDRGDVPARIQQGYSRFDPDRASLSLRLVTLMSELSRDTMLSMSELQEIFLNIGIRLNGPIAARKLWAVLQLALQGGLETDEGGYGRGAVRALLN
jgi:hypothetical protein